MKSEPLPLPRDLQAEIAKRAYELWESGGRVHGHDLAHWFQAEDEISRKPRRFASDIGRRPLKTADFRALVDAQESLADKEESNLNRVLRQASELESGTFSHRKQASPGLFFQFQPCLFEG
jgi:hypothetical protein